MMIERGYGVKQSQFVEQTSIIAGSSFGFFAAGYNYQITYDNFLNGLGVTGTISQVGDVTGVAVLDIQGTNNFIRNLEQGSGISINLNPSGGIGIGHNFTTNSVGEPILQNAGSASPTFVSIEGGQGINVETTGQRIVITSAQIISFATVTMAANATETVIASTATPVLVAGTFVVGDVSADDFTATTGGRITHIGPQARHVINALVTLDVASGNNQLISVFIAKNGAIISTKMTETVSAGLLKSVATFANIVLDTDDFIEIFVRNESTTNNVIAVNAVLSVL